MRAKDFIVEHKKGVRARKYNKKPNKFIEPVKAKKPEKPKTTEMFTPMQLAIMEGGHSLTDASYPGNIGAMEIAKFFMSASPKQKEEFKKLINQKQSKQAWALIQAVTGVKLQGQEFSLESLDEGWKDWVTGAGIAAMAAGGGGAAYDAYKAKQAEKEPTPIVAKADQKIKKKDTSRIEIPANAVPKQSVTGSAHEKVLTNAAVAAGIKGTELAQFLGQCAHESDNFKTTVEYGGTLDFKKYEPKFEKDRKTKKIIVDPKTKKPKNFNPVATRLGNTQIGDGAKFKGRGYIQLTGRYNYQKAGEALGLDLVKKPELVEKPEVAAKVAVWFWQNRVQPKVDNFNNTAQATKPINAGLKHLDQRKEKFQDFKVAMR